MWKTKVPVISIVFGTFEDIGNQRNNRNYPDLSRVNISNNTRKILETWGDSMQLRSPVDAGVKISQGIIIIIIIIRETHKLLWDYEIQTEQLISARRPDLVMFDKKKKTQRIYMIVNFAVSFDHKVKLKKSEKGDKYLDLSRELKKKTMEHKRDDDTNCNLHAWYSHHWFGTGTRRLGNKRASGDHPKYRFVEICQNTEKSPGDLRRLAVTQTPVENGCIPAYWSGTNVFVKKYNYLFFIPWKVINWL